MWFVSTDENFYLLINFTLFPHDSHIGGMQMNLLRREKDMPQSEMTWTLHLLVRYWIAFIECSILSIVRNSKWKKCFNWFYRTYRCGNGVQWQTSKATDSNPSTNTATAKRTNTTRQRPIQNATSSLCRDRAQFIAVAFIQMDLIHGFGFAFIFNDGFLRSCSFGIFLNFFAENFNSFFGRWSIHSLYSCDVRIKIIEIETKSMD